MLFLVMNSFYVWNILLFFVKILIIFWPVLLVSYYEISPYTILMLGIYKQDRICKID